MLVALMMTSCSTKKEDNYQRFPFIEMTVDSFSRYLPDAFLSTGNAIATTICISRMKNFEKVYENVFTFDSTRRFITSTRIYSDGEYYVTEYGFDKTKLMTEITYIDRAEKKILNSYSYRYTKEKNFTAEVNDENNKFIRSYIVISNKNETIIQRFNSSKKLECEFIYLYKNGVLISITTNYPNVKSIQKLNIHYFNDQVIKTELYSESEDVNRLLTEKEYQYDNYGKLIGLTQTDYHISRPNEIFKTIFKNHDSKGNWTICEDYKNRVYRRDIIYSEVDAKVSDTTN